MLLEQSKKIQCLKEIEDKLPEIMCKANLAISQKSYPEFLNIVKNSVKSTYFPGYIDHLSNSLAFGIISIALLPLTIALLPIWILLYPAIVASLPLIKIPEDCENQELKNISQSKLNSIATMITGTILVTYRDYETEARLEKEAEETRLRLDAERKAEEEKQRKVNLADNGLSQLQKELSEAQQRKKYEEAAYLRAETEVEKLKAKIAQLKANDKETVDENSGTQSVNVIPKAEPVAYYFQYTRLSSLESLAEDHDGNPIRISFLPRHWS